MIKKLTSEQFMNILEDAQSSISDTRTQVENIKTEIENRINIINNIEEYNQHKIELLNKKEKPMNTNSILIIDGEEIAGNYSTCGVTVHPKIKTSVNVLNFSTPDGYIYKNNASVSINGQEESVYNAMLMEDSIQNKGCAFAEFDTDEIKLQVTINPTELLGDTKTNIIELFPYLPGSFDINNVEIFTMQDYKTDAKIVPTYAINKGMLSVGNSRIFLKEKLDVWKIVFSITLKYRNEAGKYPFGLKHLYLINANLVSNSYIDVKASTESIIKYISEDIIITDQYGERESTCENEGIELYANNIGGELSYSIMTSKGITLNALTKNIKDFYLHVPLDRSIISIKFKNITYA